MVVQVKIACIESFHDNVEVRRVPWIAVVQVFYLSEKILLWDWIYFDFGFEKDFFKIDDCIFWHN